MWPDVLVTWQVYTARVTYSLKMSALPIVAIVQVTTTT
jgi:hypothetical protein